jgi:phosphatidylglycerophosphatase C
METTNTGGLAATQTGNIPAVGPDRSVVAVFDLDGTLTLGDTFLGYLFAHLRRRPWRIARCWRLPFEVTRFYATGRRQNERIKSQFLTAVLGGMSEGTLVEVTERFVSRILQQGLRPGTEQTLRRHRDAMHDLILLTASPDIYVCLLAERLGFHQVICTNVEWDGMRRLTGKLQGANCRGPEKLRRLQASLEGRRNNCFVVAYADEAADGPVLAWADVGVLVQPTEHLEFFGSALCSSKPQTIPNGSLPAEPDEALRHGATNLSRSD